ncbi:serine/threonine-protein kinase [Trinickia mobilis]|uniref:serine/threonine-protein kinase n=1 Tax=Trinickia mobilis TaxID=2816356 RepID=UPI001A8DBA64|nr:serine/threonine-protein kinase [Trinickia mobilis]
MPSPEDKTVIASQPSGPDGNSASGQAADSERTIVIPNAQAGADGQHALAIGTHLAEFEIRGVIGEGGFGIVYLASDTLLGRNVALKEYMPAALASRSTGTEVTVRSERHEETFRAGLKSFINEARLLAQFDHHSLVKVYRFWEANGTAYMVMPYYEGVTLRDALRQMSAPPGENWLLGLLTPLLEALAVLHHAQCYHRDIAPDNIMLLKGSGRPLLLDFGAARRVIGDMTQALTVILKPGYAPVEQYAEVPSMKQGPWTDIYALAAVVYFAIEGKTPPPAVGRLMSDNCVPLATAATGRYSETFLRAIDHALVVRPQERPQDIYAFAAELGLAIDEPDKVHDAGGGPKRVSGDRGNAASTAWTTGATASKPQTQQVVAATGGAASAATPGVSTTVNDGKSKRPALLAAAAVAVVALAGLGAWFALRPPASTATASAPAATIEPPSVIANTPPGQQSEAASTTEATATGQVGSALPPFTPSGELARIVTLADPTFHVSTMLRSTQARINKDRLQFRLSTNRAGYVYVFMVDPAGQYLMLFPNERDKQNAIAAGETLSLPRANWPMVAGAPAGPNHFLVMVSAQPRDFSDAGLHQESVFQSFSAQAQRDAATRRTAAYSPFAGKVRCAAGVTVCPDAFGATTFEIDVVNSS